MSRFLPASAAEFARDIVRAVKGKPAYDSRIAEYSLMKEMDWTKGDLDKTPEYDVMSCTFIINRIHKYEEIEAKKRGE